MTLKLSLVFLITTTSLLSQAQSYLAPVFDDTDRLKKVAAAFPVLDQMYKAYADQNHIPGLAFGIVLDGKLVHTGSMGYTDVVKKIPVTENSDFRIASMSKSFTAMAILKLRDEGKIRLDDPVSLYIPELKQMGALTKDAPPVTIRHLLTHSAGLPEDNPWGDRQLAATDEQLLALYKKGITFSNTPGLVYEYSNLGFATLGYLIRKVSGMPYQQYITNNILQPLGMKDTYWEYSVVPEEKLAHGYRWVDSNWVEQPLLHDGAYGSMGGLITSIEDFSRYMAVHLDAWPPRDDQETGQVKRSSIREMHYPWNLSALNANAKTADGRLCPTVSAYAYGIRWMKDCENRVYVGHTGGLPGFGSQWNIMPEYGLGIVCFANLTYARAGVMNTRALDTLLSLSRIGPRRLPASAILHQRKTELLKLLPGWINAESSGIFAQNFFMDYFPVQLKAEARAAFAKAGKISSTGSLVAENQTRGYFLLQGEHATIKVSFTLTPENPALIQEYHLELLAKP